MLNKIKITNRSGYTLIEIMVGVTIFMLILAVSTDFFVSSLEMQQKALLSQQLLDNISYSLEYMGKALRMAQKGDDACLATDTNYEITGRGGIKFLDYQSKCKEFYRETLTGYTTGILKVQFWEGSNPVFSLTPESLDVVSFKIAPSSSWNDGDDKQPIVTLFLEVKGIGSKKPEFQPVIKIQTTISQRNLDDQI
ncbi:MAG: prepilin-type N-terminal cleavage/methylation domain-containing protein [Candidatus Nealsonbacteria bacterium]|nr:prepilin-type N-terminal cleavage/methylation domain-containing protein [Candidatus Nealsonbacteria bacterium]